MKTSIIQCVLNLVLAQQLRKSKSFWSSWCANRDQRVGKLGNRVLVIKHDRETGKTTAAARTNWSTLPHEEGDVANPHHVST